MVTIRKATINDLDQLISLRLDFLVEDRGGLTQQEKIDLKIQLESYFKKHIPDNTFIGVFAEMGDRIVSTAYLALSEKPANPEFITGKTGTVLNVLTCREYRRQGIASKVMAFLIAEAKKTGVSSLDLFATCDGRFLYEKLGFKAINYTAMKMRLV